MSIPISNGKDVPLNLEQGSVPNVSGAMRSWFQNMTFTLITKSVQNFHVVEVGSDVDFMGVVDPNSQPLDMKAHGQRKWVAMDVYTQIGVPLEPDDVVTYLGTQYRVLNKFDYTLYGYLKYSLTQDFTGAGPS